MTKTSESVLFLFSPPMQACYSLSSAPTNKFRENPKTKRNDSVQKIISGNPKYSILVIGYFIY